jgi:hypothetical protein
LLGFASAAGGVGDGIAGLLRGVLLAREQDERREENGAA